MATQADIQEAWALVAAARERGEHVQGHPKRRQYCWLEAQWMQTKQEYEEKGQDHAVHE